MYLMSHRGYHGLTYGTCDQPTGHAIGKIAHTRLKKGGRGHFFLVRPFVETRPANFDLAGDEPTNFDFLHST